MISNPFVGPSPLGDQQPIYGRDREIRELFYLLAAERIVWLHSPSGAGKTSLVQSGLIPRLLQDDFTILPTIRIGWQPSDEVSQANRFALSMLVSLEEHKKPEQRLSLEEQSRLSLPDHLKTLGQDDEEEKCPVLLFDQFEEVLTVDPLAHKARQDFFEQLGELLEDPRLWALFSIREDYLAPLASYAEVLPTRMNHHFRLDLLSCKSAHQAIIATARDGGRQFADDAATKLVGDLTGREDQPLTGHAEEEAVYHVEPVQLQVVCRSLWERVDAEQESIVLEDLQKIGNVDRALQDYYAERLEQAVQSTGVDERLIRDWFDRQLITEAGLRGQVLRGTESSGGLPNEAISPLVDAHLIRKERRRGLVWIELAHDRLVAPVRSDNSRWRRENLSLLARCTDSWKQAGRPTNKPRLLLLGGELAAVETWLEKPENQATPEEQVYLEICRGENSRRERIRWIWRLGALLGLLIAGLCWSYWLQKLEVRREIAREHEEAAGVAFREGVFAQSWRKTLEALTVGDERLPVSLGRLLHPDLQLASVRSGDPTLKGLTLPKGSQLHGLWQAKDKNLGRVFTVSSRHVIDRFLYHLWWFDLDSDSKPSRLPVSLDEARSFAWDPKGQRLAVGDWKGEVTLLQWDEDGWAKLWSETFRDKEPCSSAAARDVMSLSFDSTGFWLAAGSSEGVILWHLRNDGQLVEDFTPHVFSKEREDCPNSRIMGLSFHPHDQRLAIGLEDGRVLLHSFNGGAPEALDLGIGAISVLQYHPDGDWLVAGGVKASSSAENSSWGNNAPVVLWHEESGIVRPQEAQRKKSQKGETQKGGDETYLRVVSLAFHPDRSDIFASGLSNGQVLLWRRLSATKNWLNSREASLELLARIATHQGAVTGLTFSRDGQELLSSSSDGSLRRVLLRLELPIQAGTSSVGQPGTKTVEKRDAMDLLMEPSAHREFLRGFLGQEAKSASGSDAWSWSGSKQWPLNEVGQQEVCREDGLPSEGLPWPKEEVVGSLGHLCHSLDFCKWDKDNLTARSTGTLQKDSSGENLLVFVDHQLRAKWSLAKAEEVFPAWSAEAKPECLKSTGENGTRGDDLMLRRWCDLTKWNTDFSGVSSEIMGRRVTFRRVRLNGQPGFIEVKPRKEVRIEFDWQVELADPVAMADPDASQGLCPGCQIQFYYGLADPLVDGRYSTAGSGQGFSKCLANAVMGPGYRGDSGSRVHSFQAPDRPGIYYVTWRFGFDYICRPDAEAHPPDISQALAAVRVLGDYEPKSEKAEVLHPSTELRSAPSALPHGALNRVAVDGQRQQIAIASFDGRARVWTDDGEFFTSTPGGDDGGHSGRLTDIAWRPNGDRLVTASVDNKAKVWSSQGHLLKDLRHEDRVLSAVFSPDGRRILTACQDGNAYLWDAQVWDAQAEPLETLEGHQADVVSAVFSPDGDLVLTASRDQEARIWDLQGQKLVSLEHQGWLRAAIFSPQGDFVATASEDKQVRVWRLADLLDDPKRTPFIRGSHEDTVSALGFSPDQQFLATASLDGEARLWSTAAGELVAVLRGHEDSIVDLAFSPDGRWIATASHDKTVRLWDITSVREAGLSGEIQVRFVLREHRQSVLAVRFIDENRLVTASFDGTARIWNLAQARQGRTLDGG